MSAKTKIIVLHMKEVIYTGIFLLLAVILGIMEPALESLSSQIYSSQSLENLKYPQDQKYTSLVLLNAIEDALKKAENN